MEELLKQTEADILEVKKAIRKLKYKRAKANNFTEEYNISVKILKAEAMLADLLRSKAEIEEYLKVRGVTNAGNIQ